MDGALQAAAAHVEANRLPAALEVLLEAWRVTPAPALADAIELIGRRVAAPSLAGKTEASKRAWREAGTRRRPEDLDRLLASWRDVPASEVAARAVLLGTWAADPRRDRAVVDILHEGRYTTTTKVWTALCALASAILDVRQLDRLRALAPLYARIFASTTTSKLAQRVLSVVEPRIVELAAIAPSPPGPAGRAAIERLAREPVSDVPPSRKANVDELRARVFEQPHDLALRAIYADALGEAGDPLGELIVLQLTTRDAPGTAEQEARKRELTKALLPAMLGPLQKVVFRTDLAFDCGFLARCGVDMLSPHLVEAAAGNPWWSTVVELAGPATIFLHPVMRSLRRLRVHGTNQNPSHLRLLLDAPAPPPLETLECEVSPAVVEPLGTTSKFPALRHLRAVSCNADPRALLDAPLIAQLETLWIDLPWLWRRWADALLAQPISVPAITLVAREDYEHITVQLHRRSDGYHVDVPVDVRTRKRDVARRIEAAVAVARAIDHRRVARLTITPSRAIDPELRALVDAVVTPGRA